MLEFCLTLGRLRDLRELFQIQYREKLYEKLMGNIAKKKPVTSEMQRVEIWSFETETYRPTRRLAATTMKHAHAREQDAGGTRSGDDSLETSGDDPAGVELNLPIR